MHIHFWIGVFLSVMAALHAYLFYRQQGEVPQQDTYVALHMFETVFFFCAAVIAFLR